MSKENDEGTRGSDEGADVEIALDDFVAQIVRDPNDPPDLLLLSGYLGASSEEGHVRLYLDEELSRYVEIPQEAIRHTQEIAPEQSPLGGSLVWIERKAEVLHGKVGTERQRASFLEGQIAQEYMGGVEGQTPGVPLTVMLCAEGGGGEAAGGFPAAAGRVAIPDPSRANPNCTIIGPRCQKTIWPQITCTIAAPGCGKSAYPNICTVGEPGCPPPVQTDIEPHCPSRRPSDRRCVEPDTEFDRRCPTNDVLCTFISPCVYTEARCWESGYNYCPKQPYFKAQAGQQGVAQQGFAGGAEGFAAGGAAAFPQTRFCLSALCPSQPCPETSSGGLLCTIIGPTCPTQSGPNCPPTLFNPPCPPTPFGVPCPPSQFFQCPSEFGQFCPPTPVLVCPSQVQDPSCRTMQGPQCQTGFGPQCQTQFGPQCPTGFCRQAEDIGGQKADTTDIAQTRLLGCQSQSGPCIPRTELPGCRTLTGIFCTRFGPGCRRTVYEPACTLFGPCQITTPGPHCPNTLYNSCPTFDFNCQATGGGPCAVTYDPTTGLVGWPRLAVDAGAQAATVECPTWGCPTWGCPTYPPRCM